MAEASASPLPRVDRGGTHRVMLAPMIAVLVALLLGSPAHAEPPRRIVSFNLCADQLLVALADPEQIAGLSPYAADPAVSVVADAADKLPHVEWQAESTIPLRPDLVLLGFRDRAMTRNMLERLGVRTVELDFVTGVEGARKQVRDVAALVGHPERGEALVAKIDAARARLAAVPHPEGATALLVERGGYTSGPQSLAAALLAEAGLHPPQGAPIGLGGFVPLEQLVVLRPDYLVLSTNMDEPSDQAAVYLTNPALRLLYPRWRRIILPSRFTLCGGPALVAGLDYLTSVMSRLSLLHPPRRR